MLINIYDLARDNRLQMEYSGNYYIYLMADGISEDLLTDFTTYISSDYNPALTNLISELSSLDATVINKYELNSDGISSDTTKPGKYKVLVNKNFSIVDPSDINVSLELVQEIPFDLQSVFYYLPFDGVIGFNINTNLLERDGYGLSSEYLNSEPNETVNLLLDTEDLADLELIPGNSQNTSLANITISNYNNLNTLDLQKLQNTSGKLLNLNLDLVENNNILVNMIYSPSYAVPVYTLARDIQDKNLNYRLFKNNDYISLDFENFLNWNDYSSESVNLEDSSFVDDIGVYHHSNVDFDDSSYYNTKDNALIKNMLYIPSMENLNEFSLSLENLEELNSDNTLFYGLENSPNGTRDLRLHSFVEYVKTNYNLNSIKDIFELVKDEKACINNGINKTYIKWIPEDLDITESQKNTIISHYMTLEENPQQGS
jgi:hypothetical protein